MRTHRDSLPPFRWLGHASVFLPGPPSVAVDPWRWRYDELSADVVLVTHAHVDHCCADDLRRARADGAVAVGPSCCAALLHAVFGDAVHVVDEGDELVVSGVRVLALPHTGGDGQSFHPRGDGVAYRVDVAGARFLFLGDGVALDEHAGHTPDVAFFAVGGSTVPDAAAAAASAQRVGAALSVPVHWGDLHGRHGAAERFVALCAERGLSAAVAGDARS